MFDHDVGTDAGLSCDVVPEGRHEPCEGRDNDCDGVVDEGCPASLEGWMPEVTTWASPGGVSSSATHACPGTGPGVVAVYRGIYGHTGHVGRLGTHCGLLRLVEDTTATPHRFRTVVTDAPSFDPIGTAADGSDFDFVCPADSVVVRVDLNVGSIIDAISVGCAAVVVVDDGESFTVQTGPVTFSPAFGLGSVDTSFTLAPDRIFTGAEVAVEPFASALRVGQIRFFSAGLWVSTR